MGHLQRVGMAAWNAYPSGQLVLSPLLGLACVPIVETRFHDLAMSLLDFHLKYPSVLSRFACIIQKKDCRSPWYYSLTDSFKLCQNSSSLSLLLSPFGHFRHTIFHHIFFSKSGISFINSSSFKMINNPHLSLRNA